MTDFALLLRLHELELKRVRLAKRADELHREFEWLEALGDHLEEMTDDEVKAGTARLVAIRRELEELGAQLVRDVRERQRIEQLLRDGTN